MSPSVLTELQGKDELRADIWATSPERASYFNSRLTAFVRSCFAFCCALALAWAIFAAAWRESVRRTRIVH